MGFCAKTVFLMRGSRKADQPGLQGESDCVVWADTKLGIDFDHISRLEKVVGERFAHLNHTPFRRAGICVVDCFMDGLSAGLKEASPGRWAPEIIIPKPMFLDRGDDVEPAPEPTVTIGGRTYIDCWPDRLKGRMGNKELIPTHNEVVGGGPEAISAYLTSGRWNMSEPPMLWAECRDLAKWLTSAEDEGTEGWKAITQDRACLAIVRGWRFLLWELGEVDTRAVFRFS